jgi:site-specific DNA-methyltransferase (adenine-specific)
MIDLRLGDCLEVMKTIESGSIDAIICDLPYGTTQNKWDSVIPLDLMWSEYERLIKNNGAIVLFSDSIFTAKLMLSNEKLFRYELVWDKITASGFLNANRMPMRRHENILLFYKKLPTYNKQMKLRSKNVHSVGNKENYTKNQGKVERSNYGEIKNKKKDEIKDFNLKNPDSILEFTKGNNRGKYKRLHPTQKPIELLEWLVKTYTNEGDIVLDNTMGSGTTMLACKNLNRNGIGIEKDEDYFKIAEERINKIELKMF